MADNNAVIVAEEDKLEMLLKRYDDMKSENEARWKRMQDKMIEMESKFNNMDQLTKDLDGIKAKLQVQTERLNNCEMLLKEGLPDIKMMPMLEEMREEMEKMKMEQTRLAQKANDDSEVIYTAKAKADIFIQLLEQKDEKMEKKRIEHETNINATMDVYKNQLEDVKTTIASMDTGSEKQLRAVEQMENKVLEMRMKDLQMQCEWLNIVKQHRSGERSRDVQQTKMSGTDLAEKMEEIEAQKHDDGDELQLSMDNHIATINRQLETIDNRVTENENKWAAIDTKVTAIDNEIATIDDGVATDDNEITTINNNLVSINKKVDANDKRITTADKKVDTIDSQIKDIDKEVTAMSKRLTWMENWQKKQKNIGLFGTLSKRDGCMVSEFTFTVKNIGEEITKAKNNPNHRIESEPFYTNIMGYRVKILVYPNDRKSNHVGVFLSLVEGEFDDDVSWPFICRYECRSVSRDGTQFASFSVNPKISANYISSFLRPQNKNDSNGLGSADYISIQKLLVDKDKYLIDGGLNIKATIWLDI